MAPETLQGRSEVRNKVIARVFRELGYIEQWGSGIGRIQQLCRDADCPEPVFKETGDFFDIEFMRDAQAVGEDGEGGAMGGAMGGSITQSSLTDRQKDVLALITEHPHMPYRQMAEALGINDSSMQKHLEKLKELGAIERIGGTRGYWKVKP